MFKRFYDPKNKYSKGILKEYKYWIAEVSYHQHTFGNYIIFCKRKGVEKISELKDKELLEFKKVCKEIENALSKNKIFKPQRFNYWQLGNGCHQLHFHGLPRYSKDKKFGNKIFKDKNYGSDPIWTEVEQDDKTVIEMKEAIKKYL
ncbi:MAG: hypothetical protein WC663_00560 [Patescibacteria group bacterium]|jgi:diadenosine tetraphosphate (Ap4A) HIT family hydrolase